MTKLQHFFSACTFDNVQNPLLQRRFDECPDISSLSGCALTGAPRTGKTSLLFQYAYSIVKNDPEANVMFVCSRQSPSPIFEQTSESLEPLKRIHMRYIETGISLRQFLANIHLLPVELLPSCICVDDLSQMLSMPQQ